MGENAKKRNDWRVGALIGLGIVLAMGISKGVEKVLTPYVGGWGAFGLSLIAVLVAAAIFGLLLQAVLRK